MATSNSQVLFRRSICACSGGQAEDEQAKDAHYFGFLKFQNEAVSLAANLRRKDALAVVVVRIAQHVAFIDQT